MHPIEYPLAFGHWHVESDRLTCRLPCKELEVRAPRDLLRELPALCTGRLRWSHVARQLGARWEAGAVDGFLRHLAEEGALVEGSEALGHWSHELGQLPSSHPRVATAEEIGQLPAAAQGQLLPGRGALGTEPPPSGGLTQLLRSRRSYRTFADIPISSEALGAILWAAHGVVPRGPDASKGWHRTIASGGDIHGALWLVLVLRKLDAGNASAPQPGIYEARFHLEGGTSLQPLKGSADDAWRMLADPRALTFASALVLPVYDIALPARKYGNRATLFATFEPGQALQNAQLMAVAVGAAACVRGDIDSAAVKGLAAQLVAAHSGIKGHFLPSPGLLLGAAPDQRAIVAQVRETWIQLGPLGSGPAGAASPLDVSGAAGFGFHAGPIEEGPRRIFTSGRSADPRLAVAKAEAEAWERRAWAALGETTECAARDLAGAMDPSLLLGYTPRQYASRAFPFTAFSDRRKYLWRAGADAFTGAAVFLPAECVYALSALPAKYQGRACTNSSTSGIAAWTDAEGALCRATLELIERDGFLRQWLSRQPPDAIDLATVPLPLRTRVSALEDAGYRVTIARVGAGFVPVLSVFIQGRVRPFTAITAAADFDPASALDKALTEAEGRVAHGMRFPAQPLASAREVQSPADINRFYQTPRHHRRSDFYADGPVSARFDSGTEHFCPDWSGLRERLRERQMRLIAVDITPPDASIHQGRTPLHVVRAFVPGLLPIWFQYGLQPAAAVAAAPRCLSDAAFIHPFT